MKSLIAVCIILVIAAITNPSKEDHIDALKELFMASVNETMVDTLDSEDKWEVAGTAIGYTLGMGMIDKMAESFVHRKNFAVFSLTEINFKGESRIIGIGAFGNVWIFHELNNAIWSD